jgi:hypothetical protein
MRRGMDELQQKDEFVAGRRLQIRGPGSLSAYPFFTFTRLLTLLLMLTSMLIHVFVIVYGLQLLKLRALLHKSIRTPPRTLHHFVLLVLEEIPKPDSTTAWACKIRPLRESCPVCET